MAVVLNSQPKTYCPAHWSVPFGISLSDLGTPPTRIDFGYYLAESGGTRLMEDKKYTPFATATEFTKDFKSLCRGLVYTSFPAELATQQTDSNIIKAVKLKYGEVSYNSNTCATVKTITFDSNVFYLLNAGANTDTQALFGTSSGFTAPRTGLLLSQRPDWWELQHGAKDYLWFLGAGTITVKYYNGTSQLGSTQTFNFSGATTVKYICLDYSLYSITTNPTHAIVTMWDGANGDNGKSYRINYCFCPEQDNYLGVLFLEPMGGRGMLSTGKPLSIDQERTATTIYKPMDLTQSNHKTGGRSVIIPVGTRKLTFENQIDNAPGTTRWLQNFISSPGHHAQRGYGANTRWEKFILDTGSVKLIERNKLINFQFSGYISEEINSQSEDI